jgi:hypothetical protein
VYACADVYPDWSEFNDADMAACLCYNPSPDDTSSLVWVPNQFDAPWDYCPEWASTMDPYDYSAYVDGIDFCTQVGNVLSVYSTDWGADYAAVATTSDGATTTYNADTTSPVSGSGGSEKNTASPATYSLIQPVSSTSEASGLITDTLGGCRCAHWLVGRCGHHSLILLYRK